MPHGNSGCQNVESDSIQHVSIVRRLQEILNRERN